jgi:hypothetical protein
MFDSQRPSRWEVEQAETCSVPARTWGSAKWEQDVRMFFFEARFRLKNNFTTLFSCLVWAKFTPSRSGLCRGICGGEIVICLYYPIHCKILFCPFWKMFPNNTQLFFWPTDLGPGSVVADDGGRVGGQLVIGVAAHGDVLGTRGGA